MSKHVWDGFRQPLADDLAESAQARNRSLTDPFGIKEVIRAETTSALFELKKTARVKQGGSYK